MKKTLRQQIDELAAMDVAALQTRHLEFFGKETTCAHRQFLFRKLAWHLQAKIVNWSCDAGPEFRITAPDGLYELNLPCPTHSLTSASCGRSSGSGLSGWVCARNAYGSAWDPAFRVRILHLLWLTGVGLGHHQSELQRDCREQNPSYSICSSHLWVCTDHRSEKSANACMRLLFQTLSQLPISLDNRSRP